MLLVFIQPDIGTTIVLVVIVVGILVVAGTRLRHLLALAADVHRARLTRVPAQRDPGLPDRTARRGSWILRTRRTPRTTTANKPSSRSEPVGCSGRVPRGTQTNLDFVPEQHTDFIFTVVGEEFGFVGAAFVLVLFAILIWRAIRIAYLSKDPFGTYVAAGVAAMFAIQMFVNVGMVIGIMPITGIPLPFVSYGGIGDARELHRGRDPVEHPHAAVQVSVVVDLLPADEPRNVEPPGPVASRTTSPSMAAPTCERWRAQPHALVRPRVERLGLLERRRRSGAGTSASMPARSSITRTSGEPSSMSTRTRTGAIVRGEREGVLDQLLQDPAGGRRFRLAMAGPRRVLRPERGRCASATSRATPSRRPIRSGPPRRRPRTAATSRARPSARATRRLVQLLTASSGASLRERLGHAEDHRHRRPQLVTQP